MRRILAFLAMMLAWGVALATSYVEEPDTLPARVDTLFRFPDYRHWVVPARAPHDSDVGRLRHRSFWRASAEVVGLNLSLWAFDRYVEKGHYAYISWNTIKENFRHGFEWDNDHLSTNMFAHPYNGSMFYNAGRSNGFNFWQSELFAIGGSAMWEMCMECEYPSTNDIIATPVGGAAIGEVLYRTSDVILDDRSTGAERFGRELAAFVVDPMRGLTRIVTGRAWRRGETNGRRFGTPPVTVELSLGGRLLAQRDGMKEVRAGAVGQVYIQYGDRFAMRCARPYDYFSFFLELQGIKTQPLLSRVEIIGRLLCREVVERERLHVSVGMYQHFDFFDSDTIQTSRKPLHDWWPCVVPYKLGTPASVGAGVLARYVPVKGMVIDAFGHVNGVLLAGILTDFYRDYHRNYNWGSGFSIKGGFNISLLHNRLQIHFADRYYGLYTWKGFDHSFDWSTTPAGKPVNIQGDQSKAFFNHLETSLRLRVAHRLYLTAGLDWYHRQTNYYGLRVDYGDTYTYTPIIESSQLGAHLMVTYHL